MIFGRSLAIVSLTPLIRNNETMITKKRLGYIDCLCPVDEGLIRCEGRGIDQKFNRQTHGWLKHRTGILANPIILMITLRLRSCAKDF
jgi:hypothetical protein